MLGPVERDGISAVFHFLFRAIGMLVLALALIAAVLDLTRSIAASALVMTPAGAMWGSFSPGSLDALADAARTYIHPYVWEPVLTSILSLPAFLLLWLIAMVLLWMGQKRQDRYGRFAR